MVVPPRNSTTPSGVHLWLLLWKAARAHESVARRSISSTGLCVTDFGILEALLHKGPMPVNTLAHKVLISSGSMTAAVNRLQREGVVERRASAKDRRERIAHLTPKGRALITRLFAKHARDMDDAFDCLDEREKEELARLLRKVGASADTAGLAGDNPPAARKGTNP